MTIFGLFTAWLAAQMLDAFFKNVGPSSTTPPTPRRGPPNGSRRRPPIVVVPGGGGSAAPSSARPALQAPPWPQVVPSGLPAFPGGGWEPDDPPPPAVVSRAAALLGPLWRGGQGTFKVEQTDARWIAYQAALMGTKRGVVAWRLRSAGAAPLASSASSSSALGLPTLRLGSRGKDVVVLQNRLGISPADGIFGRATQTIVVAYQASHGLKADGIVGRETWASLLGRQAA